MARNRIDRVTTRDADAGMTSLADGARHGKHEAAIGAVGALDEANSCLGLLAERGGYGLTLCVTPNGVKSRSQTRRWR